MRGVRALVAGAVLAPLAGLGLATAGVPAGAADPGPVQFPLTSFGVGSPGPSGCGTATWVVKPPNPNSQISPSFVLVNPGPTQCPAGIDVLRNPGPPGTPEGEAVSLPLTAGNCPAAIDVFTQELALVGSGPTGGPGAVPGAPASSACPDGDGLLASLEAALVAVPTVTGAPGFVEKAPGPAGATYLAFDGSSLGTTSMAGYYLIDSSGTPNGDFLFKDPGPTGSVQVIDFVPSATPGVANGVPSNGLPGNGTPGNGTPGNGLPDNGLPDNGQPGNGLPANGLAGNGTPGNGTPGNGTACAIVCVLFRLL